METKKCTVCGNEYPATSEYFYSQGDKLQSSCKECRKAQQREKYAQQKVSYSSETPLSQYRAVDLITELANRGYEGELTYTKKINIAKFRK